MRHAQSALPRGADHSERHEVRPADDGSDTGREQVMGSGLTAFDGEQRLGDESRCSILWDSEMPLHCRDEARTLADDGNESIGSDRKPDTAMTHRCQVRNRKIHRCDIVIGDEGCIDTRGETVDEHHGQAALGERAVATVIGRCIGMHPGYEDDAGYTAIEEKFDVFILPHPAGSLSAEHGGEAVLRKMRFHHLGKGREDRVRKLRGHQSDEAGLASQPHGPLIAEDIEGGEHGSPRDDRSPRPVIEHSRHRCLTDPGHLGDVGERGSWLLRHGSTVWAARSTTGRIGAVSTDLMSLLAIAIVAAAVPLIVGLLRVRIADVVLLIAFGIILGPQALGVIKVTDPITLLAELGLAMLFFLAGLELEQSSVRGQSGRLAAAGWAISLLLAGIAAGILDLTGVIDDFLGISIALTSTALGTLLPVLRDSGELTGPFGRFFMGAGAWGEFGPIIAIAVLLGSQSKFMALATLLAFGLIAVSLAVIPQRLRNRRINSLIEQGHHTSAQTAVRLTMLVVILLLAVADGFGLDAVLGAFAAGVIVRRFSPASSGSVLESKVQAIGFGFLIPVFFIVSGANLDIDSIIENPLLLILFFVLLLIVRGVPQFFLYRGALPDIRQRARFSLLVATGLPIIVAVTTLETQSGIMRSDNAAALVGAGALSVLVFPLAAAAMGRKVRAQDRAANTE